MTRERSIKLVVIGDIIGNSGRKLIKVAVKKLTDKFSADLVIANGENAAGGFGICEKSYREIISAGVNLVTTGNHIWQKPNIKAILNSSDNIIRPANFNEELPGKGWVIKSIAELKIAVVNLQGRVFMPEVSNCPFEVLEKLLNSELADTQIVLVDFHAEATSEKQALAYAFDGRISALFGTHTHVQTADEKILPQGCGYISDLGMCGPEESIIGMEIEPIIKRFKTGLPEKFSVAKGESILNGVFLEIDSQSGKCLKIERIKENKNSL